ncbi:MAG: TetR/AcrR family transcriptional regulator [Ectothiorhodospiraceae bacterium]|nr:TetR/AcrR family transcriptional regulator [Ectothiorhodospiraceae bacterium]MCH8504509.1 TetR/AcrR family transcriptional regulator [Ectothiorhodospiraceae bacterium]
MAARQGTRQRILEVAEELFQHRGYGGFSYQQIAERLGVRNAAVHYHFPSKTDLVLALLRRYRSSFIWWQDQMRRRGETPERCLEAFFALERRYMEEGKVCPLGVVGVESEGVPDVVRAEAAALADDLLRWLTAVLTQGGKQGALRIMGAPEACALALMGSLQAGLQLARLKGPEVFYILLEQQRGQLGLMTRQVAAGA